MVHLFKKDKNNTASREESTSINNKNDAEKKSWSTKMKSAFCCSAGSAEDPMLIKHSHQSRPEQSRGSVEVSPMTTRADSSARGSVVTDLDCEFKQAPMTTSLLADEKTPHEKSGKFHLFGRRGGEKQHLRK
ncbi:hypothetical protein FOZ61_007422 [Perkinsus olseni]|uniref:Uncharacterized protein n=1 Tax=Perkinsus olseni TaxID=32597 RepID=A0A7J6L995_PEROL|nr:hypothetical protein FOZ61_007422 [Perkinsus olseni]